MVRKFNIRIPLREGIALSADLVLPEELPAPVVVVRTPYGKAGERQSQRGTVMANGGYACMHVDVRGRRSCRRGWPHRRCTTPGPRPRR